MWGGDLDMSLASVQHRGCPPLLAAPVLRQFLGGVCRPGPCDGDFTSEDPQLGFQGYLGLLCSCAFPEAGWE